MAPSAKNKGLWLHRFAVRFFTIALGILFFWLLGFLLYDIESGNLPSLESFEKKHVDKSLQRKVTSLQHQINDLDNQITRNREAQKISADKSRNLKETMNQVLEVKRAELGKDIPEQELLQLPEIKDTFKNYFDSQEEYKKYNQKISELTEQRNQTEEELVSAQKELNKSKEEANTQYKKENRWHDIRMAAYQILVLLIPLTIAIWGFFHNKNKQYVPIYLAFGAATALRITIVLHEYFPSRLFKYILLGALVYLATRLLLYFIKAVGSPKVHILVRQYRDSYEKFLCPLCEYPIRTGPRRFLYWTRQTVGRIIVHTDPGENEEAYTCPNCGQNLFDECSVCHKIRATLLPYCSHCGASNQLAETENRKAPAQCEETAKPC